MNIKNLSGPAYGKIVDLATEYIPQLLLALVTLVIGLWVIRIGTKIIAQLLNKRGIDQTVAPFLQSLVKWSLKAVLFISVASMVGIKTTSFVAILGAAGLAVGLALQGSLSNFAGGVLILIFRPYKVGDLLEAQGQTGVVKEIQIFTTSLVSPQGQLIIIPNGAMANGAIKNFSAIGVLRVDLNISISSEGNIEKVRALLLDAMNKDPKILISPAPVVAIEEFKGNEVKLAVRPHATTANYWDVYYGTLEMCKRVFAENNIS